MKILFILISALSNFAYGVNLKDCRSRIKAAVCIVDPVDESNPFASAYQRPCLPSQEKYTKLIQSHFDRSIPAIQRMYCSIEKIWIENELNTTAYATPITDLQNNLVAGGIGINRKFIDSKISLADWFSIKEETSFGGAKDYKKSKLNLIRYSAQSKKKLSAVDYALNHELGHLFDYANKVTESESPFTSTEEFNLCFYECGSEYLNPDQASALFEKLLQSDFQSLYATENKKEDWAEMFALYMATQNFGLEWKAQVAANQFDLSSHFYSERLAKKRKFIQSFLKSDLRYPSP